MSSAFPVVCPECLETRLSSTIDHHRKTQHGRDSKLSAEELETIRFDGEYTPRSKGRTSDTKLSKSPGPKASHPKRVVTFETDKLVDTVLTTLYPKGIPVTDMPFIREWTAATEAFLRKVGG